MLALAAIVSLFLPAVSRADEDDASWTPTSETKRFDASASICIATRSKADAEQAMLKERAYSKRYGVTDLGKLNFFKDSIMEADDQVRAASAALKRGGQRPLPCSSPLLGEFVACVGADDPDFQALSIDERLKDCHKRGYGIPAEVAPSRRISAKDFSDADLARLSEKVLPSAKDLAAAQVRLAKSGLESERMEMALVCGADLAIMAHRPFASVVGDLSDIIALRSPSAAVKRLRLSKQDAFGGLLGDQYTDVDLVARLSDDRGFSPRSLLASVCSAVASKEDGQLGILSMRTKGGRSAPSTTD